MMRDDAPKIRWNWIAPVFWLAFGTVLYFGLRAEHRDKERQPAAQAVQTPPTTQSTPTALVDGQETPVSITWNTDGGTLLLPKTYGFAATRFAGTTAAISKTTLQNAEVTADRVVVDVPVRVYLGPSESASSLKVTIPRQLIPPGLMALPTTP
jgi:hypothetical protein